MNVQKSNFTLFETRFQKRMQNAMRLGIEIAMTIGSFGPPRGEGRLKQAFIGGFQILYFTPFNQPTQWRDIDWHNAKLRRQLYGLTISLPGRTCLKVFWTADDFFVDWFRDPSQLDWDGDLRRLWKRMKSNTAAKECG